MFWGLIMEPKRRYTQVVKKAFHISMASLDISSGNSEPTQVLLTYESRNYLLCTLQKGKDVQVPLDLNFEEGNEVSFATNGSCHVHLTGYLITETDLDEEEEEEDQKNAKKELKTEVEKKKRKGGEDSTPDVLPKKTKTAQLLEEINSNSDDSDDLNFSDILKEGSLEEEEDSEDDEEMEEESSDENGVEDSGDDESDEDDAEEESSLSDDAFEPEKPKVNGVTPKKKEKKQNQISQEKTPKGNKESQQKTPKKELGKTPKETKSAKKDGKTTQKEEKTPQKGEKKTDKTPIKEQLNKKTLEGGVQVQDLVAGTGQLAKPGKFVQVYYEGRLKSNNKVFDSVKQGAGFKFRLGSQEVIKGWDVGVQGMKVGGKRRIVCPPNMAYGQKGSPPVIPANSTLIFEVELKNVH